MVLSRGMAPEPNPPAAARGDRIALVLTLALLAAVLVVAARTEPSATDARLGRRVELLDLIAAEQQRNEALSAQVEELSAQVAAFEDDSAATTDAVAAVRADLDGVVAAAGMTAVEGPGLVVTLTDSSLDQAPSGDLNDLVVHEQDLQAVVNALWAGGAEAMTVNGQRVLATTAIRCVGNTLLLHGAVYSPPYVVAAVGDGVTLRQGLDADSAVRAYAAAAAELDLGFEVASEQSLALPAYEGSSALKVARPVAAAVE